MPKAMAALQSDATVQVETGPWITFRPTGVQPTTGFIFYPGGRVDPRAYAPQLRQIAEHGYLVVLVPMPLNSLADSNVKVTSIYATHDGLATGDKIAVSKALLPASTTWVPIKGGNHAGFGWYGPQPGDGTATISREAQQAQTVDATVNRLASLGGK